jgi:hypothetical protein
MIVLNGRFIRAYGMDLDSNGCPLPPTPPITLAVHTGSDPGVSELSRSADPCSKRLVIRVTPQAHAYAHALAAHCSLSLTDLIWQTLYRQADTSGFHHKVPARFVAKRVRRVSILD